MFMPINSLVLHFRFKDTSTLQKINTVEMIVISGTVSVRITTHSKFNFTD